MELGYSKVDYKDILEKINISRNVDAVDINERTALHIGI